MFFVIKTTDKDGQQALRDKLRAAHLDYLDSRIGPLVAGGGLLSDDGERGREGVAQENVDAVILPVSQVDVLLLRIP